jgi:hypothetical protein
MLSCYRNRVYISTLSSESRLGLDWKLDLLNTYRSVTTSNYNRFINTHKLYSSLEHTRKSVQSSLAAAW